MTLDPTKIHVESHTVPIWEREETFQDLMNEQLKHAPWLGLSILIHAVALLLLFLLIPDNRGLDSNLILNATPEVEEEEIEEEEEEPEEEEPEEVEEEEVVEEEVVEEEVVEEEVVDDKDTVESAFDWQVGWPPRWPPQARPQQARHRPSHRPRPEVAAGPPG
ncbi:MAG: hypothetical protein ACYST0_06635 [Planctomycetota bacterium]|jgi:intein/homing endonuclease